METEIMELENPNSSWWYDDDEVDWEPDDELFLIESNPEAMMDLDLPTKPRRKRSKSSKSDEGALSGVDLDSPGGLALAAGGAYLLVCLLHYWQKRKWSWKPWVGLNLKPAIAGRNSISKRFWETPLKQTDTTFMNRLHAPSQGQLRARGGSSPFDISPFNDRSGQNDFRDAKLQ